MSREVMYRCDRCMVAFDGAAPMRDTYRIISPALDGEMDLCADCATDLEAWVRSPLEPDDAIDPTTGQVA